MHELLERLGREIVRKQSIHDPGQRQFLVDGRDICKVQNNDTVSGGSVIGAIINVNEIEDELYRRYIALERFSSLQFLRFSDHYNQKVRLVDYFYNQSRSTWKSLNNLPRKVRLLDWEYFRMTSLPSNFNPEFVIELNMPHSKLVKLWEGNKTIRNLKWMDLGFSKKLRKLPDLSTATNLCELDLCWCSNLVKLPSSIGDAINLKKLNLTGCSSLMELPSSIGNAINLKELDLSYCSRLGELPSSIGNAINLEILDMSNCLSLGELPSSIGNVTSLRELYLRGCSSLVKLPSSIGNIIRLSFLDLSGCSSLVKLPSSIGNLKLEWLSFKGCSKLEAIPINMESLRVLDITDCFLLKTFPEISTNIEVPSSLQLHISCWENLGEFSYAFKYITDLHLSDTRIQEIAPCIKELSRLRELVIKGCTKLVSLPQLPDSLIILDAENCESLERLNCSFHNTRFLELNFINCFKLSQKARDLIIIKTSNYRKALLPGEKVPPHFTYRATGSSLPMKLNGFDTDFPTSLRFKACILLVSKGDVEIDELKWLHGSHSIKAKQNGVNVTCSSENIQCEEASTRLKKHLLIFQCEEKKLPRLSNSSNELVFEFQVNNEKFEIEECGIQILTL